MYGHILSWEQSPVAELIVVAYRLVFYIHVGHHFKLIIIHVQVI